MKMMVVGGKRSNEFASHLQSQFSIATQVLPGFSLEDVERTTVLGNVLERVLVLEPALTIDGVSEEPSELRKRIGELTRQARERNGAEQYVFMALSPEMARLCYEETYDICDRVAVVCYEQKVTVVILYELLSSDITALRNELYYVPPITEVEDDYTVFIDVSGPLQEEQQVAVQDKRIIKKVRGAAVQRQAGNTPWYGTGGNTGVGNMSGQGFGSQGIQGMFAQPQSAQSDKGFKDESPLTPKGAVDMSGQLKNMFQNTGDPFGNKMVQPAAVIPVTPEVPVTGDTASFIRSKAFKGYALAFVGPGGSGSTFMALNCAARIHSAGFSTAFMDGDLNGHSAQYLTKLGIAGDVLMAETDTRALKPGFDMYGAGQFKQGDGRFWGVPPEVASRYDFLVFDIPFASIQAAAKILPAMTKIAITVDSSNWGIGKAALTIFNTPVDVAPTLREKAKLVFNRSDKLTAGLFGGAVGDAKSIKRKVEETFGARAQAFAQMPVVAIVGTYASAEEYWFSDKLFSDSAEGGVVFDKVVRGLLG